MTVLLQLLIIMLCSKCFTLIRKQSILPAATDSSTVSHKRLPTGKPCLIHFKAVSLRWRAPRSVALCREGLCPVLPQSRFGLGLSRCRVGSPLLQS